MNSFKERDRGQRWEAGVTLWLLALALMFVVNARVCARAQDTGGNTQTGQTAPATASQSQTATTQLPEIVVKERSDNELGIADTSTQGTIGHLELEERPILRPGEVLEAMPGVIVTQHSGDGKANQYFLRGFNLDHGTDLAGFFNGIPMNLPSNAHGEGYLDLNFVIPELIQKIDYGKGPYFADVGDYGGAGWENIQYVRSLPQDFMKVEFGGGYYERALMAASTKVFGGDDLLGALELVHTDGPWDVPEDYVKYNGYAAYNHGDAGQGFSASALGYHGTWNATNQIPELAVSEGLVDRFGNLSPTDGGLTDRYLVSGEYHQANEHSATSLMGYAYYYHMDLWNNFNLYFPELPDNLSAIYGDQFEQIDTRWVQGFRGKRTWFSRLWGLPMETTFGFDVRNDVINDTLNRTYNRAVFLEVRDDDVIETDVAPYVENKVQWLPWFRTVEGFREDLVNMNNHNIYTYGTNGPDPADSGNLFKNIPEPKLSLIFGPWAKTEFYLNGGISYHTDDVRGATTDLDPLTGTKIDVFGNPVGPCLSIARADGAEVGVRTLIVPHLQSTLTFWALRLQSDEVFDGDTGTDEPTTDADLRKGVEWANYYTPTKWLTMDADFAYSTAHFLGNYEALEGGPYVPEAARGVISCDLLVHDVPGFKGWSTGLRWRYFGPRYLTTDGSVISPTTSLLYYNISYRFNEHWLIEGDIFNLLNSNADDITYFDNFQLTPTSPAESGLTFHAAEPRTFRIAVTYFF